MHFEGKIYEDVKKKKKKITPTLNTTMRSKYIKTAIFKELESVITRKLVVLANKAIQ